MFPAMHRLLGIIYVFEKKIGEYMHETYSICKIILSCVGSWLSIFIKKIIDYHYHHHHHQHHHHHRRRRRRHYHHRRRRLL